MGARESDDEKLILPNDYRLVILNGPVFPMVIERFDRVVGRTEVQK